MRCNHETRGEFERVPEVMGRYKLLMNPTKTEYIELCRGHAKTTGNKKLGSIFSSEKYINYKMARAPRAFHDMTRIWLNRWRVKVKTKIRLYNACVKSILLENIAAVAVTEKNMETLSAFHRRQLRFLLGVFYPRIITNEELYRITGTYDIRIDVINCRWKYLGHVLRLQEEMPAYVVMKEYLQGEGEDVHKYRGMLPTSLPTLLQRDIKMISGELRTVDDLETLREIAQDREAWRQMTSDILREKAKRWGDIVRIRTEARKRRAEGSVLEPKPVRSVKIGSITLILRKEQTIRLRKRKWKVPLDREGRSLVYERWEGAQGHNKKKRVWTTIKDETTDMDRRRMGEFNIQFSFGPQDFI